MILSKDKRVHGVSHVTPPDGNVFADIGFDPEEAANLKIRPELMLALHRHLQRKKLKQK